MLGGQKRLVPSMICGTPMRSSGANWLPSKETHGNPTCAANCWTRDDLPIPGGPQINTGRTMATLSKKSESCVWVSVIAVFMNDAIPSLHQCALSLAHSRQHDLYEDDVNSTPGVHRHDGAATLEQRETMVAWSTRCNVTVPTCGEGDTCATVRMQRRPQGKPDGCSRGPAGARLAPGRCVSQSCMTKEPEGAYGHTCHPGWFATIHTRRALSARANLCWSLSCRW